MSLHFEGPYDDHHQENWLTMPWEEFLQRATALAELNSGFADAVSIGRETVRDLYAVLARFDDTRPETGERRDPLVINTTFGDALIISRLASIGCEAVLQRFLGNRHTQN